MPTNLRLGAIQLVFHRSDDEKLVQESDFIARAKLSSSPRFNFSIHDNFPTLDHELGLSTRRDAATFEKLIEMNGWLVVVGHRK